MSRKADKFQKNIGEDMKIRQDGETLNVSEILELGTVNSALFNSELAAAFPSEINRIEIDLSDMEFVDCGGVGALVALHNRARRRNVNIAIRLRNPAPTVRRIFNLTRMDRLFPIESN